MAKGTTGKAFKQDIKQALPEQQEILRDLGKQKAEVEKIKQSYDKLNDSLRNTTANSSAHYKVQQKLNDLLRQYDGDVKNLLDNLQDVNVAFEEQKKRVKSLKSELTDYVDSWGELEGLQASITNEYGRQSVQAKSLEAIVDKTKAQYNGITSILNNNTEIQGHQRDVIIEALDTYKNFPVVLNGLEKQLKRGQIGAEGFQETIIKTEQGFQDLLNQMDEMIPGVKEIKTLLEELPGIMKKSAAAAAAMKKQFEGIDAAGEVAGFFGGGVAGGSGLITNGAQMTKDLISGTDLKTLSFIGIGIGAAELIAQLSGTQLALAKADNAIETALLETALKIQEAKIQKANFLPDEKELIKFNYQLQGLTAEFDKSSKTALFGAALGEMPYATDQMQLAGIGAESVTSALNDLSKTANIGIFPKLAANAAVFAKKMGISTSELGTQIGLYRQLNRVGGDQAMTGVQSSITSGVIDPTTFSADMADASKLAMIYNIKSYQALSKQVKALRMMGVSFAEIAEDGKNMVLNYKDSIKSEMQLSAMLGENVDLSEVRALIAANDIEGAQRAFNATGLAEKARAQGLFTTDMLQKTVGSSIQMGGLATKYQPGQNVNAPSNAAFLEANKQAQQAFNIKSAYIAIDEAIDMSVFGLKEQEKVLGDREYNRLTAKLIQQDAQNVLKLQAAKGLELFDGYMGVGRAPSGELRMNAYNKLDRVNDTPTQNKDLAKYGYDPTGTSSISPNKTIKNSSITPPISKGVDYISRMPDKQQELINLGKETQKLQQKITTSAESQTNSSNYLKNIDTQSTLQTQLLQNIQALTAAASRFNELKFGDMKLMLDGKEVKSRIEKITTQQKPISR
jgi:hypothetical protein